MTNANVRIRNLPGVLILILLTPSLFAAEPRPAVAQKATGLIHKDPQADITGIVFDNRQPVGGVIVQAWYMGWMGRGWRELTTEATVTDRNGKFAITMPRRRLSGLKIIARTANWRRMGVYEINPSSDPEEASERHRLADPIRLKGLEVRLAPAVSREIQVVDGDGKPVAGANVGAYLMSSWHFGKAKTDQQGHAKLWLPAAIPTAEVFAWKPELGLDCTISSFDDPENEPLKLTLRRAPKARVIVLDALTNKPFPKVKLTVPIPHKPGVRGGIAGLHYGFGISVETDETGQANIDWLPDWVTNKSVGIWAMHGDRPSAVGDIDFARRRQLTLKMPPVFRLRGRVLLPDGTPAKDLVVEASNGRNIDSRDRAVTDQNGHYELVAPSDLKCVVIVVDDKWGAEPKTEFTVEQPGLSAKVPDIRLSPAKRVHGVLRVEEGKTAVPNEQIWLHVYSPPVDEGKWNKRRNEPSIDHRAPYATLTTWTDKNGQYEFHIGPCAFRIQAPSAFENLDGLFITRGYSYWSRNLPARENSMEYDFLRPIWSEMP